MFQLTDVVTNTLARTTGFLSFAFAAVSILYASIFMVNFSPARSEDSETSRDENASGAEGDHRPRSRWDNVSVHTIFE
jgi:preprotein translocase subunit SecG